jgi:hypothetical protein
MLAPKATLSIGKEVTMLCTVKQAQPAFRE